MTRKKHAWIWVICLLFITCCQSLAPAQAPPDLALKDSITSYLAEQIGISGFGGEVFCAFEYLQPPPDAEGEIYIWALCLEFYREEDRTLEGSGISLPVALQISEQNGQLQIASHLTPGDGSYYGPDVKEIFPASTWGKIFPDGEEEQDHYNLRASRLMSEARDLAGDFSSEGE